jgi:ribonuclease HII
LLVGVDEAGRGPLAGPVVAAAVVFPVNCRRIRGVRDSKTLMPADRAQLAVAIRARALAIGIGAASRREIDRLNIRVATAVAMRRAVARLTFHFSLLTSLDPRPSTFDLWIDGLPLPEIGRAHQSLVDGDVHCYSIAAAGIIAKVARDGLMVRLHRRYPDYGWGTNAGYATDYHRAALERLGPTPHHRRSFAPVAQLSFV